MKYFYNLFIVLFLGLSLLLSCTEKETTVEVSSVSLNTATIEMVEGETFNLVATVLPKDAEYDGVIWASSNVSVASVKSGTVTALKEGTATITASAGGKSSTCNVKVSAKVIAVTSITLDKASLSMQVGETETLTATVNPADASDKTVTWGSSDVSVVTVANGKVVANKSGTAIITAKSGNCIAECVVTASVNTASVTIDKSSLSLAVGETSILTAVVKPDDATDKNVVWSSSDESVAKVSNGNVTAIKVGTATITAKCGGKSAECFVTVTVPTGAVTLDKTSLSMAVGESAQLIATVSPADATDKNVVWTSSDESVVKVSNGKVTAIKAGSATITAKCGGKAAECVVTVTVPVVSISIDKTSLSLVVGETTILTATVNPDNASDKNVSWSSSDKAVAKVENGKVTALKTGKTTITATCGGQTAECVVTVTIPVSSISIDKSSISLAVGETATLTATVKPDDATDKSVTWSSSNASVATVADGKVVALKSGQTTITARSGGKVAECAVTVVAPVTGVTLDKTSITLVEGETATLTATVKPDNATDKTVVWRSSDESVARVSDGKVSAIKTGAAKIEVAAADFSTYCDVTVVNSYNAIDYTLDEIYTDVINPFNKNAFGANIVSNEVSEGKGRIIFDAPVTSIGPSAFYNCRGLRSIKIPGSVTSIGESAFLRCSNLKSIEFPPHITKIGNQAFKYTWISDVVLPKDLITIGDEAFLGSTFKILDLPKGLQSIGLRAFMCCNEITKLTIPGSVISIDVTAFSSCEALSYVEVEEGVTILPPGCFSGCKSLSVVKLPSSITQIGFSAFEECSMFNDLYLKVTVPPKWYLPTYKDVFDTDTSVTIWVPRSSVDAYKAAEGWSKFKDNIKGYDF